MSTNRMETFDLFVSVTADVSGAIAGLVAVDEKVNGLEDPPFTMQPSDPEAIDEL